MLHSLIIPKGYGILFPFEAAGIFKNFELPTQGVYKFKPFLFVVAFNAVYKDSVDIQERFSCLVMINYNWMLN